MRFFAPEAKAAPARESSNPLPDEDLFALKGLQHVAVK